MDFICAGFCNSAFVPCFAFTTAQEARPFGPQFYHFKLKKMVLDFSLFADVIYYLTKMR